MSARAIYAYRWDMGGGRCQWTQDKNPPGFNAWNIEPHIFVCAEAFDETIRIGQELGRRLEACEREVIELRFLAARSLQFTKYAAACLVGESPLTEEYKRGMEAMGHPLQDALIEAIGADTQAEAEDLAGAAP